MDNVMAFISTNGWNMRTGGVLFTYGYAGDRPLKGLPWKDLVNKELPAVTVDGILYVVTSHSMHDCNGLAYNPRTNRFPASMQGFKPIGGSLVCLGAA